VFYDDLVRGPKRNKTGKKERREEGITSGSEIEASSGSEKKNNSDPQHCLRLLDVFYCITIAVPLQMTTLTGVWSITGA
jgi:hypothetical protein